MSFEGIFERSAYKVFTRDTKVDRLIENHKAEAYPESSQTSKMEFFAEILNRLLPLL